MRKKLLLMLGAAVVAVSASATVYKQGEAFAYTIDPSFTWDLTAAANVDPDAPAYVQYPVDALKGQADMEYGFGMTSVWFNAKKFENSAEADEYCPVVADPWDASKFAVRMKTTKWDGFGNFNFALPVVNEPCRIRVIYRVNEQDAENTWYNNKDKNTFKIKLMSDGDQDAHNYNEVEEYNEEFWNNPGWRIADFVETLDKEEYFLSILWDAAGLSCQRNVGFYLEEVSVVPLSKLEGYTAPADGQGITVSKTFPDLVEFEGAASGPETYTQGDAFAYDIDPTFTWMLTAANNTDPEAPAYVQYPVDALKGQADMELGFGMTSVWFNAKKFETSAEADEYCPVVEDPWDSSKYAVRMKTTKWDGFGNFNFALPFVDEPCRIRVVYRVNEKDAENTWYNNKDKNTFKIKLMSDGDQDAHNYNEVEEYNEEYWNNPGWRIAEFVETLDKDEYFLSILWDAAGLSCQRNVGFYLNEVSVVPVSKLEDYTAPAEGQAITVSETCPDLVRIVRPAGVDNVVAEAAKAEVYGAAGAVVVKDFEGVVEVYNMMGMQVAKVAVNGNATIAAPAGMAIVKAGNTVAKVVVR